MDFRTRDHRTACLGPRECSSASGWNSSCSNRGSFLLSSGRNTRDQGNPGTGKVAEMRHGGHWKKVAVVAWRTHKHTSCGRTCPPRQRIHDLGCGIKSKTPPRRSATPPLCNGTRIPEQGYLKPNQLTTSLPQDVLLAYKTVQLLLAESVMRSRFPLSHDDDHHFQRELSQGHRIG